MFVRQNVPVSVTGAQQIEAPVSGAWAEVLLHLARQTASTPTLWAEGVVLDLYFEVSNDNGVTWDGGGGGTGIQGGIRFGKDGVTVLTETIMRASLRPGVNRARVNVTVTGGTLTSLLSVEVR